VRTCTLGPRRLRIETAWIEGTACSGRTLDEVGHGCRGNERKEKFDGRKKRE